MQKKKDKKKYYSRFIDDTASLIIRALDEKNTPVCMESHLLTAERAVQRIIRKVKEHYPEITDHVGKPEEITRRDWLYVVIPSLLLYWRKVTVRSEKVRIALERH